MELSPTQLGMDLPSLVIVCDVGRSTDVSILRIIDANDDHNLKHIGSVPHLEHHVEIVYMTTDQFATAQNTWLARPLRCNRAAVPDRLERWILQN